MGKKGKKTSALAPVADKIVPAQQQTNAEDISEGLAGLGNLLGGDMSGQAADMLKGMLGNAMSGLSGQSKTLFDSLFGKLLGGEEKKISKDELIIQTNNTEELTKSVKRSIDDVLGICESIRLMNIDGIAGLEEIREEDLSLFRNVTLTKKQEKILKKKNE